MSKNNIVSPKHHNILASYWSISGDRYPDDGIEVSNFDFRERMEVAGKAGFRGAGFVYLDLMNTKQQYGWKTAKQILDDNGIVDIEVEMLYGWYADGEERKVSDARRQDLFEAGAALGARHIKVSGDSVTHYPIDHLIKSFESLCKEANEYGMLVAFEMMPWIVDMNTIEKVVSVIRPANCRNGGILLDSWHLYRGGEKVEDIFQLKPGEIIHVEIADVAPTMTGDIINDSSHHRLLPGEGILDMKDFVAAIESLAYDGPYGIEIISKTHRKLALQTAAEASYKSARRFVA